MNLGSNNWVTAPKMSAGDHAILAGDPHLDPRMLPGIMYAIGIVLPDNRAVGAGVPGIPGFIVGRNKYVATAVTNSYGDVQDLYVETLDPENSAHYLDGGESRPLSIETEVIRVRDAGADEGFREHVLEIASTARGPIVSGVLPGLDSGPPISLRWAAVESMQPRLGLTDLLKAESIEDVERALQTISFIVLNFVFADDQGNIAWRVSGQLPLRSENSGEAPFPVPTDEAWADNWTGWIPFDEMPHRSNPDRGWLGTANHYTVNAAYPYYFTNYASPSYRYRRLKEQMAEKRGRLTIEDHWSIQRDTKNLLAAEVTPILVAALSADAETKPLAAVLADWDFHDNIDHSGPTVFQSVYTEFARAVFADELGEELASMMLGNWYYWQERFQEMVSAGECRWFDDQTTTDRIETRDEMIRRGGRSAMERLSTRFGNDPRAWHWGKVHTIEFVNPIRRSGFGSDWLGTGKIPVAGSGETLYRGWYDLDEPFGVTHTAAVRMVVDFGDDEKVRAVLAGGEVGRTFHPHQQDQIDAYISGKPLHWWFSQEAIEQHATSKLKLVPAR